MSEMEFDQKQAELDRLQNDPCIAIQPDRIWALLEDLMAGPNRFPRFGGLTLFLAD